MGFFVCGMMGRFGEGDYYLYHSLSWLKTAKTIGGSEIVKITRNKILRWIKIYKLATEFFSLLLHCSALCSK